MFKTKLFVPPEHLTPTMKLPFLKSAVVAIKICNEFRFQKIDAQSFRPQS